MVSSAAEETIVQVCVGTQIQYHAMLHSTSAHTSALFKSKGRHVQH